MHTVLLNPGVTEGTDAKWLAHSRAVLDLVFGPAGERPFAVRFWNGAIDWAGGSKTPEFTLVLPSASALREMWLPPSELRVGEAFVHGAFDVDGNLEAATALMPCIQHRLDSVHSLALLTRHLLALPRPTSSSAAAHHDVHGVHGAFDDHALHDHALRSYGHQHSLQRDRAAIHMHYDVGNAFYALWLDARMVYSCAYFPTGTESLDDAQTAKLELICRKLRLQPGERFLDIGCGWGGLVMYAAANHGVSAVGITLSEEQAALARERIAAAGLSDRCEIRLVDYRELSVSKMEPFDKVASVGMVEHVGHQQLRAYFEAAYRVLRPGGLFLNHGIVDAYATTAGPWRRGLDRMLWRRGRFIEQYVFPDGDLVPIGMMVRDAEAVGFEVRDVESLREHYATTLRHWVGRLEAAREEALALVGEQTYRIWRLYMAASAYAFASRRIGIAQTLLAKPDTLGRVPLPRTRADLYATPPLSPLSPPDV